MVARAQALATSPAIPIPVYAEDASSGSGNHTYIGVGSKILAPAPAAAKIAQVGMPEVDGVFHVKFFVGSNGNTASASSREAWLRARRSGVTATDARKLVRLNGTPSVQRSGMLQQKLSGDEGIQSSAFAHGIAREPIIAAWVLEHSGIHPNSHLCIGENPRHMATPDGVGDGVVCEIKTSVKPIESAVSTYRDQLQWQLHVTGSERVLFVVEDRDTKERRHKWVERDELRIATLVHHADYFLTELDEVRDRRGVSAGAVTSSAEQGSRGLGTNRTSKGNGVWGQRSRTWSTSDARRLVESYAEGESFPRMVERFDVRPRVIAAHLASLILNVEGNLCDPSAGRFGRKWNRDETEYLVGQFYDGIWLPALAATMERDQTEVALSLFEHRLPGVPQSW